MILFHAGFDVIDDPDITYGRKNADFGQGFYMTPNEDFAFRWAKEKKGQKTIVNRYELDETDLDIKRFKRGQEWFDYIYANRGRQPDKIQADVIIGPIANDIIYDTMGITTSGVLPKDISLALLMIGPEYQQVVIKTEKAKSKLKWLESTTLTSHQMETYAVVTKSEEEQFQQLFAAELERLTDNQHNSHKQAIFGEQIYFNKMGKKALTVDIQGVIIIEH